MKRILFSVLIVACGMMIASESPIISETVNINTTGVAGQTTNTTLGTVYTFPTDGRATRFSLTARAIGIAATTNGSCILKFATSNDGTNYANAADTNIKLKFTEATTTTNFVTDWYVMPGAHFLKHIQTENTFLGAVSNIAVRVGY